MINKDFFKRGVIEVIDEKSFWEHLKSEKKQRIKYGVDPTRPDIHLGHAVAMWRLRELQDNGHTIIFLIGDYTTKIGDPSGRNSTRPVLTDLEIEKNAKTYFEQAGKILDLDKTEIRYNSEWFKKLDFNDVLRLTGKFTVAQIIERDDFEKRLKEGTDVGLHEVLYPVMQAYDSVILNADVEFGGSDQRFNLLAGRDLQKKMDQRPQDLVIMKLLVGTDGKVKMSKSADNYIGITDAPDQMFGKVMSIPDSVIVEYFELATKVSDQEIEEIKEELNSGKNPRDIKIKLAKEIVKLYHDEKAAKSAAAEFKNVFSKKELPAEIPEVEIEYGNYNILTLLSLIGAVTSNSEARRLVGQGGVKIDEARITDPKAEMGVAKDMVIQVGKQKYYKVK